MNWTEPAWISDLKTRFPRLFEGIDELNFAVGEGWKGIVTGLCEQLDALHLPELSVTQVKEKFGTLRFYVSGGNEEVSPLIRLAEDSSATTCEHCGAPGTTADLATLCKPCRAKLKGDEPERITPEQLREVLLTIDPTWSGKFPRPPTPIKIRRGAYRK